MTAIVVVVVVLLVICIGYIVYAHSEPGTFASEPPPTEEELYEARIAIARVERGVDLALTKQEVRMASAKTKEAIAEALER